MIFMPDLCQSANMTAPVMQPIILQGNVLVTAVALARQRNANSILVDGGDQFQGTLFYIYYEGQLAAEMMNQLGYDGMTVGNHECDDGPQVLRGFIDAVTFPV